MNINLNAPSGVAQIEKVALAHVAMRGDAASRAKSLALREFFAHLRDGSVRLEAQRRTARHLARAARRVFVAAARSVHSLHPSRGIAPASENFSPQAGWLCHKK